MTAESPISQKQLRLCIEMLKLKEICIKLKEKTMVTVIKKGSSAETVREKYEKHRKQKDKDDIKRFCGVIKLKEDPMKLQKEWRDEWE